MANPIIYPGSSSFFPGQSTPFGFFDNDYQFQVDADKVAKFCAQRLGYPVLNVELQDVNFYTAFEAATIVYGNELYAYQIRDNLLNVTGLPSSASLNNAIITPSFAPIVRLTQQYGEEAGAGGNVDWKEGYINAIHGQQDYDLADWAVSQSITGGIEVKRVFYYPPPAVTRFYDPYVGGFGNQNLMDSFGFGNMSPAIQFVMMPINYDIAVIQQIEMSDTVRRSQFSFEIVNNKLKIFPIPWGEGCPHKIWFQYITNQDRLNSSIQQSPGLTTNVSNAPYGNPVYNQINSIGRSWIFEYSLSLCKEMLGYIRGKYQTIPIPGNEETLNQQDLLAASTAEKIALITKLREYLDQTSNQSLLERKAAETQAIKTQLGEAPMQIYIA